MSPVANLWLRKMGSGLATLRSPRTGLASAAAGAAFPFATGFAAFFATGLAAFFATGFAPFFAAGFAAAAFFAPPPKEPNISTSGARAVNAGAATRAKSAGSAASRSLPAAARPLPFARWLSAAPSTAPPTASIATSENPQVASASAAG